MIQLTASHVSSVNKIPFAVIVLLESLVCLSVPGARHLSPESIVNTPTFALLALFQHFYFVVEKKARADTARRPKADPPQDFFLDRIFVLLSDRHKVKYEYKDSL